ncbi:MAG: DUF3857 domain-containing protein [Arachidicoccus sp.]|nr:DUF3857 domain-containing protein [Arachidicoccus sp.]
MKFYFLLIVYTLFIFQAFAQDKIIGFGKPDNSELELKDCDFDPGQPLECLVNLGTVTYNFGGGVTVQTETRKKFKVFKEAGISKAADVKIRYYSKDGNERISTVEGYVYNLDSSTGKVVVSKLKKSDVFDKPLDNNYSEISFALPDVRVGSVVEYKYTSYRKSYWNIRSWFFQNEYPVKYSAYNLIVPDYFNFTYQVNRRQDIEIKKSTDYTGNWFIMRNIASIHEEPYMSGWLDYMQRVDFNLTTITPPGQNVIEVGTNWQKQCEEYLDDYSAGGQLKRNIHHPEDLDAAVALCKNDREKVKTVYEYVQSRMKCNDFRSISSDDNSGVKSAWDKKQGSIADINFLVINWLRDYKINALPLLVSTHDHGLANPAYVDLNEFDAVMIYAETESTPYIMNAADKYTPYNVIPRNINFTSALIADNKTSRWISISDTKDKFTTRGMANFNIARDGKISGFANLTFDSYARIETLKDVEENNIKSSFALNKNIGLKVDSFEVENKDDISSPLNINLSLSGTAKNSGNYLLIPYNEYCGPENNPFTADKRQTAIQMDVLHSYNITGYINIADGLAFEDMPKNILMRIGDSSIIIRRIFQKVSDSSVSYLLSINFLAPAYPLDEYPDIKAFYKKMFELLDEKIVIKRTK